MITIEREVNVSLKRLNKIFFFVTTLLEDLNLTKMKVVIVSSTEMGSMNADGLCCCSGRIDIVNKRDPRDLFLTIAHELRHAYQFSNNWSMNNIKMEERDAEQYESKAFNKFKHII
jgi:hypothetical protein